METLEDHFIPEWRDAYFNPDHLLYLIKNIQDSHGSHIANPELAEELYASFMGLATSELRIVSQFFTKMQHKVLKKQDAVTQQSRTTNMNQRDLSSAHSNLVAAYTSLKKLIDFADANASTFFKLVRQFDQLFMGQVSVSRKLLVEFQTYSIADTKPLREQCYQLELACADMLNISTDAARIHMMGTQRQHLIEAKQQHAMLLAGIFITIAVFMLLCLSEVMIMPVKFSPTQQCAVRLQISVCFAVICLGVVIRAFDRRHINYQLIWDLPAEKLTATYRTVLAVGSAAMALVLTCVVLATAEVYDHDQLDFPFGRMLGDFVDKINANTIIAIPMVVCVVINTVSAMRYSQKGRSKIWRFSMIVVYQIITPWAHRVTFVLFYFADVFTSCTGFIRDALGVVSFSKCPDYVLFICLNIPGLVRMVQCFKRYLEPQNKRRFYPHCWNLLKYFVGVLAQTVNIHFIQHKVPKHVFTFLQFVEFSAKLYWDVVEDGALFWGGTGAQQFKSTPSRWANRIICRRPTSCSVKFITWCVCCDVVGRYMFVLNLFGWHIAGNHWWKLLIMNVEVARRFMWGVMRLDNQQATNCENYEVANYFDVDREDVAVRRK